MAETRNGSSIFCFWIFRPEDEMPFSTPMSAAIFFVTWFIVLFAVLPFGVKSQQESGDVVKGTDPGAPIAPHLLAKAVWTTVIAAVAFGALCIFAHFAQS